MAMDMFRRSIKRLASLDALIIVSCDLLLAIPLSITWYLVKGLAEKLTLILGKVTISTELMMQNPSIAAFNVALFRQATLYSTLWVLAIALVWAISLGILNAIQWQTIAHRRLSSGLGRFAFMEAGWALLCMLLILVVTFFILDPARIPTGVPMLTAILAHLSLGLHVGLLQRTQPLKWNKVQHLLAPAFRHGWRWLLVYGLLCGTGLLTMIIFGFLVALGIPGMAVGTFFGLIALAWWRMMSWDILSGNVKKIP